MDPAVTQPWVRFSQCAAVVSSTARLAMLLYDRRSRLRSKWCYACTARGSHGNRTIFKVPDVLSLNCGALLNCGAQLCMQKWTSTTPWFADSVPMAVTVVLCVCTAACVLVIAAVQPLLSGGRFYAFSVALAVAVRPIVIALTRSNIA
jgi:hypothetical protein